MEALSRIDILGGNKGAGYRIVGDWQKNSIEFLGNGQGELLEAKVKYPLLIWSKLLDARELTVFISFEVISKEMKEILKAFLISLENRDISVKVEWKYTEHYEEILLHAREVCDGFQDFEIHVEQDDKMFYGLYSRFFEVWMSTSFYKTKVENYFDRQAKPDFYLKLPETSLGIIVGNSQKANITFSGRMFGTKGKDLWEPLSKWTEELPSKCENKTLQIDFKLVYVGDKHAEVLGRFLKMLEKLIQEHSFKVSINWFCNADDEVMLEMGEDFLNLVQGAKGRLLPIPVIEEEMQEVPSDIFEDVSANGKNEEKNQRFHIREKKYIISADAKKGYIALSGDFYGDPFTHFIELQNWSKANLKLFPKKHINVYMNITYLDHSSLLSLRGMFRKHELLIRDEGFTASYFWYNLEDDEDMMEEAESFSHQCLKSFWNCDESDDEDMIEQIQESFRKGNGGSADFKYIEIPE